MSTGCVDIIESVTKVDSSISLPLTMISGFPSNHHFDTVGLTSSWKVSFEVSHSDELALPEHGAGVWGGEVLLHGMSPLAGFGGITFGNWAVQQKSGVDSAG